MSIPVTVQHTGALNGSPPSGSLAGTQSLAELMRTDFSATFGSSKGARPSIIGATFAGTPFTFPFETITKVKMFALRVLSGSLKVRISTPNGGAQQIFPVSNFFLFYNPNTGDHATAIDAEGTADVEYVMAGDTT